MTCPFTSALRHVRLVRDLNRGRIAVSRSLTQPVAIALFLALAGLTIAIYLVSMRDSTNRHSANHGEVSVAGTWAEGKGIINKISNYSIEQTVEKLENILQAKGITLFALIDHSGEAEKVGMKMRPTKLLIFGSPKAGTPLMVAAPSIALDLPLKILVWEDAQGKTWVSHNSPTFPELRYPRPACAICERGGAQQRRDRAAKASLRGLPSVA
jgi:uncharacterized protein (DUF302 family)